jgi:hypothetical protein
MGHLRNSLTASPYRDAVPPSAAHPSLPSFAASLQLCESSLDTAGSTTTAGTSTGAATATGAAATALRTAAETGAFTGATIVTGDTCTPLLEPVTYSVLVPLAAE